MEEQADNALDDIVARLDNELTSDADDLLAQSMAALRSLGAEADVNDVDSVETPNVDHSARANSSGGPDDFAIIDEQFAAFESRLSNPQPPSTAAASAASAETRPATKAKKTKKQPGANKAKSAKAVKAAKKKESAKESPTPTDVVRGTTATPTEKPGPELIATTEPELADGPEPELSPDAPREREPVADAPPETDAAEPVALADETEPELAAEEPALPSEPEDAEELVDEPEPELTDAADVDDAAESVPSETAASRRRLLVDDALATDDLDALSEDEDIPAFLHQHQLTGETPAVSTASAVATLDTHPSDDDGEMLALLFPGTESETAAADEPPATVGSANGAATTIEPDDSAEESGPADNDDALPIVPVGDAARRQHLHQPSAPVAINRVESSGVSILTGATAPARGTAAPPPAAAPSEPLAAGPPSPWKPRIAAAATIVFLVGGSVLLWMSLLSTDDATTDVATEPTEQVDELPVGQGEITFTPNEELDGTSDVPDTTLTVSSDRLVAEISQCDETGVRGEISTTDGSWVNAKIEARFDNLDGETLLQSNSVVELIPATLRVPFQFTYEPSLTADGVAPTGPHCVVNIVATDG